MSDVQRQLRQVANAVGPNGWPGYGNLLNDLADILALLDERDALAARLDRIEHAARELLAVGDERAWDGFHGPEDIEDAAAALRGALGDDDDG